MFDSDLINRLPEPERSSVRSALVTLHLCGVIELQEEEELARLAAGSTSESHEALAARIVTYRHRAVQLRELTELGETFVKEQNNEVE